MRAATIRDREIVIEEHPDPEPGHGEVLVRVRAAGLNGADMMQRRGLYPAPPGSPQDIPGMELAGEVAALGPGAERFAVGDRVMAIVGGGAPGRAVHRARARRYARARRRSTGPRPGGLPEVFATAHDAVFTQGELRPASACSCTAAPAASAPPRSSSRVPPARASPRPCATSSCARRSPSSAPRRSRPRASPSTGPFDVILELVGAPNLPDEPQRARHRRADRRDRRRRRRQGRDQPARADGQARAHPRLHAARPPARAESARRAPRRARGAAAVRRPAR